MPEAPEGWYPNPEIPGEELYWLGDRWSNARRPVAAPLTPLAPPVAPPLAASASIGQPTATTVLESPAAEGKGPTDYGKRARTVGIVALICAVIPGVHFIAFIPAILAIALALKSMFDTGNYGGKALAGLIMGIVALLVAVIVSFVAILNSGADEAPVATVEKVAEEPAVKPTEEPAEEPVAEPTAESEPASEPAPEPAPAPAPAAGYGTYPDAQAQFVSLVEDSAEAISAAETDLQRSQLLITRDQALCTVPTVAGVVENWVGEVIEIGANGDGLAYVTIEIAPTVVVKTWNNAFSDIGSDTLIDSSAPFFQTLVPMTTGTKVVFSGDFLEDDGVCVSGANLTETFYGSDPDFLVRFSNIDAQ